MNGAITESWRKEKILRVLELCYFECYQNCLNVVDIFNLVLEIHYSEYQHIETKCIAITKPWLNLKRS